MTDLGDRDEWRITKLYNNDRKDLCIKRGEDTINNFGGDDVIELTGLTKRA